MQIIGKEKAFTVHLNGESSLASTRSEKQKTITFSQSKRALCVETRISQRERTFKVIGSKRLVGGLRLTPLIFLFLSFLCISLIRLAGYCYSRRFSAAGRLEHCGSRGDVWRSRAIHALSWRAQLIHVILRVSER